LQVSDQKPRRKGKPYNPALAEYQQKQDEAAEAKRRDRKARDLLKNAQEASSGGEAVVEVQCAVDAEGAATIMVSDRGSGMSDDVLKNALVPFFSTKEKGTGLGLALCREIVEAHRGKLRLARRDGGGMEVTCMLPGKTSVVAARTGRLTLTRA